MKKEFWLDIDSCLMTHFYEKKYREFMASGGVAKWWRLVLPCIFLILVKFKPHPPHPENLKME